MEAITKTEQNNKGGIVEIGRPVHSESLGEQKNIAASLKAGICPVCGERLRYGSQDCESLYYWCSEQCGAGPFMFPLGEGPRPVVAKIIDAEESNKALRLCSDLRSRRTWKITEVPL